MINWQEIIIFIITGLVSTIVFNNRQEKTRNEQYKEKTNALVYDLSERIVRVESEIVTEREVREVLHELVTPFSAALEKIEGKQDTIAQDLTDIKIALAQIQQKTSK